MKYDRILILSIRTALSLAACVGLVVLCYFQIDRPVAWWCRDHSAVSLDWLKWPDIIKVIIIAAPISLLWAAIVRFRRPWRRAEAMMVTIASSVLAMTVVKQILKFICGRTSTRMWIAIASSAQGDSEYGFHWFRGFFPYDGFPSGHMAIACNIAAIVWHVWPKWRVPALLASAIIGASLILTDYHFVGDVIAGGVFGWIVGAWTVECFVSKSNLCSAQCVANHG
jgi:membrane-associated phospholipid phosphatase